MFFGRVGYWVSKYDSKVSRYTCAIPSNVGEATSAAGPGHNGLLVVVKTLEMHNWLLATFPYYK